MAKISAFRALIYNQEKIKDLSRVVCPPYDIISHSQQEYYHNLNSHNLIHILLGKDIAGEDKYRRAAHIFNDWQKNKILIQDDNPAIYFYSQQYNLKGEKKTRLGFIARLFLEDSTTFGHEHTHLEPKEDRLKLLKSVKASLSPVFVIFPDKKRIISSTYQRYIRDKKPFIDIIDGEGAAHKLWRLDAPDILERIKANMQKEKIFIADGHHRFEVACAYRDKMRKKAGVIPQGAGFDYILAYFTNTDSDGLTILPIHRLVKPDSSFSIDNFKAKTKDYFELEEIRDKARFFFLMEKAASSEHVIGMYHNNKFWLIRLRNIKLLDKMIGDKPPEFRALDVSILNYIVLKRILGMDLENKESIRFSPHINELIESVNSDPVTVAFFLNPVKVGQLVSVALSGEKMPPKSTYFYPKVLSGLVINKHG